MKRHHKIQNLKTITRRTHEFIKYLLQLLKVYMYLYLTKERTREEMVGFRENVM